MFLDICERLGAIAAEECERRFGVRPGTVQGSVPPRFELGDIAFSFPFEVAKRTGGGVKPRAVAEAIAPALQGVEGVRRVDVAGGGYLNVFLDRPWYMRRLFAGVRDGAGLGRPPVEGKIVIEHTNINPNKAAHIGHVRNAVLGDTLARVLRALGSQVEVQNYIDDTGVQVADVVVGFKELEGLDAARARALPEPFDHYCWDLYARVGKWYQEEPSRQGLRQEALRSMEDGHDELAQLGQLVSRRVVENHLRTAARLDIHYDLLAWEGDILRLGLWSRTFERLKETPAVHLESEGKNSGCWMMRLEGTEGFEGLEDADKVLVRSNGTATYVAKDIAYQMWKFGLSAVDFYFAPYGGAGARPGLWTTTSAVAPAPPTPFGHATRVYNVIDVRQSYLQGIVARGLEALGFPAQARNSIHYSYEMVALTPRCCEQLGVVLEEADRARPYVEMSGRKGLGIKADDLLDRLAELATAEVASRHPDRDQADARSLGEKIALGAIRYFMLRFGRTKVVAFDLDEALRFHGETGPYLQNSVVRCRSIFRKLEETGGPSMSSIAGLDPGLDLADLAELEKEDDAWDLVFHLGRLEEVLAASVATLELSLLARWAFQAAQRYHKFYERFRIKDEADVALRTSRAAVVWMYSARLTQTLSLMGIPVPERM